MPNVLMIGAAEKAAGDRVRIPCDWGNEPGVQDLLLDSNGNYDSSRTAFTSYNITCTGAGAPIVSALQLDYKYQTSALVQAGSVGTYNLVFSVTLNDGDATVLSRTGTLEIR